MSRLVYYPLMQSVESEVNWVRVKEFAEKILRAKNLDLDGGAKITRFPEVMRQLLHGEPRFHRRVFFLVLSKWHMPLW